MKNLVSLLNSLIRYSGKSDGIKVIILKLQILVEISGTKETTNPSRSSESRGL